jgi:hypothetical protein
LLSANIPFSVSYITVHGDVPANMKKDGTKRFDARPGMKISTATAFLYKRGETFFIGTNRHVFETEHTENNEQKGLVSTQAHFARVTLNINGVWTHQTVQIRDAKMHPLWKADQIADLALLQFTPDAGALIHPWTAADILPTAYALELAESVVSMGYPLAFYDNVNHRPVLRHGSMASEYGIDFKNQPYFLTDINHFPGNSGSPVITREKQHWPKKAGDPIDMGAPHCLLAGIHSRREYIEIPKNKDVTEQAIDLGLGVTWYARLIEALAASFS